MAEEKEKKASTEGAKDAGPKPPKGPLILALVNVLVVLAAAGSLVYTRILFKRPPITEDAERERIAKLQEKKEANHIPSEMVFEPVTINIAQNTPHPASGSEIQEDTPAEISKLHYATIGFTLELKDLSHKELLEPMRPIIMDKMLSMIGRKPFHELATVQGRYVLRTQILELANQLAKETVVTNVFFTQFIIQ